MAIHFRKITSTASVIEYLAVTLKRHLDAGERVLWLVPGGSSIALAVEVSRRLAGLDLSRLIVTLTDERYGAVGHADSNWRQLAVCGFDLPGATLIPVLTGLDLPATVEEFTAVLKNHLYTADYSLGFFGIGPDGHTAGILPGSPAVVATKPADGYDARPLGSPFQRLTMTAPAIAQLDEAVVYAVGEAKWPVLDKLATNIPLTQQPAQALKSVPALTIFNDHKGAQA